MWNYSSQACLNWLMESKGTTLVIKLQITVLEMDQFYLKFSTSRSSSFSTFTSYCCGNLILFYFVYIILFHGDYRFWCISSHSKIRKLTLSQGGVCPRTTLYTRAFVFWIALPGSPPQLPPLSTFVVPVSFNTKQNNFKYCSLLLWKFVTWRRTLCHQKTKLNSKNRYLHMNHETHRGDVRFQLAI